MNELFFAGIFERFFLDRENPSVCYNGRCKADRVSLYDALPYLGTVDNLHTTGIPDQMKDVNIKLII